MIGVIGGGAFGTALACAFARDGSEVRLWVRQGAQEINASRGNKRRLPGIRLPGALVAVGDLEALGAAKALVIALPAQSTGDFLDAHLGTLPGAPLVLCAKGLTRSGGLRQSQLVPEGHDVAVLTGPGFAQEIARGCPTALTLASARPDLETLQSLLARPSLRLYRSSDVIGAELGGALKNVIAIAAGIAIGAGLGESARAAIVTRGFAEMRRLALAIGARDQTLNGLSGLGDLMLTSASPLSRNFACGLAIGQDREPDRVTTEGVATAAASLGLAARFDIEMPVAQAVSDILNGRGLKAVMEDLLARPLRAE